MKIRSPRRAILTRAVYAEVILRNGQLVAWLKRGLNEQYVTEPKQTYIT